jgi:hypothetical protein
VSRAELFADNATQKNITWHDLRATGLTWLAIRGEDPLKIMQRAGHVDFNTTQGYVREAETVREGFGKVFSPMPIALIGPAILIPFRSEVAQVPDIMVEAPGIEHDPPSAIG